MAQYWIRTPEKYEEVDVNLLRSASISGEWSEIDSNVSQVGIDSIRLGDDGGSGSMGMEYGPIQVSQGLEYLYRFLVVDTDAQTIRLTWRVEDGDGISIGSGETELTAPDLVEEFNSSSTGGPYTYFTIPPFGEALYVGVSLPHSGTFLTTRLHTLGLLENVSLPFPNSPFFFTGDGFAPPATEWSDPWTHNHRVEWEGLENSSESVLYRVERSKPVYMDCTDGSPSVGSRLGARVEFGKPFETHDIKEIEALEHNFSHIVIDRDGEISNTVNSVENPYPVVSGKPLTKDRGPGTVSIVDDVTSPTGTSLAITSPPNEEAANTCGYVPSTTVLLPSYTSSLEKGDIASFSFYICLDDDAYTFLSNCVNGIAGLMTQEDYDFDDVFQSPGVGVWPPLPVDDLVPGEWSRVVFPGWGDERDKLIVLGSRIGTVKYSGLYFAKNSTHSEFFAGPRTVGGPDEFKAEWSGSPHNSASIKLI